MELQTLQPLEVEEQKWIQRENELKDVLQEHKMSPAAWEFNSHMQKSSNFKWVAWDVPESDADAFHNVRCLKGTQKYCFLLSFIITEQQRK